MQTPCRKRVDLRSVGDVT